MEQNYLIAICMSILIFKKKKKNNSFLYKFTLY